MYLRHSCRQGWALVGFGLLALTGLAQTVPAQGATDESSSERPRPDLLVVVQGGPDKHTIWRGWPVLIQVIPIKAQSPASLTVSGPAPVSPQGKENLWVIPAATCAQLSLGTYTFSAGAQKVDVVVKDPPAALTPDDRSNLRRISLDTDLLAGSADRAVATAKEWVAAEPKSSEAYEGLGDALRAAGDRAGAAQAYNEAIRYLPSGVPPPGSLFERAAQLDREIVASLPTKPASPPNPDAEAFYQAIDAGDAAMVAGKLSEADQKFGAADALYHDRHLTLARDELDQKRAQLRAAVSAAAVNLVGSVVPSTELTDATVAAEPLGQWAASATASSEFRPSRYSARQATGAPDVTAYADDRNAWASATEDDQPEWIELTYARAVQATEVRVRQTFNPGAITQIELYDEAGQAHVVWSGLDPARGGPAAITWFGVKFPPTWFRTQRVRIRLDSPAVKGRNEIDAVQLVGQ